MKRLPYQQMILGLDRLLLNSRITDWQSTAQHADAIDEYIEQCGWSWKDIIDYMIKETEAKNELAN